MGILSFMKPPARTAENVPDTLELSASLDLSAAKGDGSKPVRFKLVANSGEPMELAGFIDPVIVDLRGARFDKDSTPVIADHDTTKRIGHTDKQEITSTGITAEGIVSSSMAVARGFVEDARNGFPFQVSVGASIERGGAEFIPAGEETTVNGKKWEGPLVVARKTLIRELSVTVLGADSKTKAEIAATRSEGKTMTITADTINAINAILRPPVNGGWNEVTDEVETLRASATAGEISLGQLADKTNQLRELQARRSSVPSSGGNGYGPAIHVHGGLPDNKVLEAAVAQHVGGIDIGKHYGDQAADVAGQLGITCMMDAMKLAARMSGRTVDWRNHDSVIKAAFSSADISDILSNVANKSLEVAYRNFPSAARMIARKLDANDFKEHTGVKLTGDVIMERLGESGEIKHAVMKDQSYTYSVETFAKMFGLTRQQIVNDDASALSTIPQQLARGAALAVEEVFWALVIANTGSYFSAGNGNYFDGASSALDGDSLATAVQKFLEQTDSEGKPIGVVPRFLTVAPALKAKADELFTSRTWNVGASSANTSDRVNTANSFFGLYEPVVSPWIGANGLAGGSDTAWYLFGPKEDVAAFGIAYLNGLDRPQIEQADQPADKLGVIFRGWIDFGVCQIDHRGGVKSKGAS